MRPCSAPISLSGALAQGSGRHPLQVAELKTYDWRLTRTARPETARKDIALVEIDEYSLRNLQPYAGRWPWPRVVHAMLVDYLARAPARIIVYDVNFAEPDTRRGFDFAGGTLSGVESDQALVESIKAAGNVILLADATFDACRARAPLPETGFAPDVPGPVERRVVYPPFAALARPAARSDTTSSFSIPTVRSGTPCRSCGPASHVIPRSAWRPRCASPASHPGEVRFDGDRLVMGDRDAAVVAAGQELGRRSRAICGAHQLSRPGAARTT